MQIEVGKSYKAANGQKVTISEPLGDGFIREVGDGFVWSLEGICICSAGAGGGRGWDIVAEWQDEGPVQTVTRRVIVPGLYGIVAVYRVQDKVRVTLTREDSTPDQLEAAARTLQQLAEALRVLTNES